MGRRGKGMGNKGPRRNLSLSRDIRSCAEERSDAWAIDIASKLSGRVIELAVDEGNRVKKGDKLAVVQPGRSEAERYLPFTVTSPIDGIKPPKPCPRQESPRKAIRRPA